MWTDSTKPYPFDTHPLDVVSCIWNGRNDTFPGPQPCSIERLNFKSLQDNPYFVCDKTDGVRHAFICCDVDNKHIACTMNRQLDCRIMNLKLPRQCTKGTVLDGEIIQRSDGQWIFLVYDCVAMCGRPTLSFPFQERMSYADTFINSYKESIGDALVFQKKMFFPLQNISAFLNIEKAYNTDGVIIIPANDPIKTNSHFNYFKLKNGHENTVDFAIDNNCSLFLQQKGLFKKTMNIVRDSSASGIPRNVSSGSDLYAIVECSFIKNKEWTVKMHRPDKTMPNSLYTHKKTMLNIKENIQTSELQSLFT